MRLFLDTNVLMEFIGHRAEYDNVRKILLTILHRENRAFVSQGSVYTLAYLVERLLKENGIHRPELTEKLRRILSAILSLIEPLGISRYDLITAICNEDFTDIEDSFQYQCASVNRCGILITLNVSDYRDADLSRQEVLTPAAFIEKYM